MDTNQHRRLIVASAAVSVIAGLAVWSGLDDGDAPVGRAESSASAAPTPTDEPVSEDPSSEKTSSGQGSDKSPGSDTGADEGPDATSATKTPSTSPSPDEDDTSSADEADESGDEVGDGDSVTLGTGDTVSVEPVQTLAPVPLDSVGDFRTGLTVRFRGIEAVQAEATAPGEISGPGLRVTVAAANDGDEPISLDNVVVFLAYGSDRTPASQFGSLSEPLAGDLPAAGSAKGTYVFSVPVDQRDDVRVEVSYSGSAPTVAFTGSVDG
ncbi:hypothetical protein GCM10023339_09290 [Alloalcanivorax gelatiniphagus]